MATTAAAPQLPPSEGVATHCPYCALQCAMTLTPSAETGAVTVSGRDFPTNRGGLCRKGWTSANVLSAPDRLTTPLIRRGADLTPASWDEAFTVITDHLTRIITEHGADGVAVFGGGGLTNEKAYQLGKFARVALGTRYIDYNGRFCMSSAAAAGNRAFGIDRGLPFPLTDLNAAEVIVLVGSNIAETMPPAIQHLNGARDRGGLVVIDPRHTATAALTDNGHGVHLRPVPGTDLALLLGLAHVVLHEHLSDDAYLRDRTAGLDPLRESLTSWWPEHTERVTGIPADTIRRVARQLADAAPHRGGVGAFILTGRGAEQHAQGAATVTAAINLALLLGLPGRPASGYGCITGQGNGQGGREHGQKSDQLPGYRRIDDPAARAHVAEVWGVPADTLPGPGVPAVQLLHLLGTSHGPRALFVHGSNLVISTPNAHRIVERLAALDLLVVADIVLSETAAMADVVLPVTQWAEEEGTMTTLEGRIIRRRQVLPPPGQARSELWIWQQLAARLGCQADFPTEPSTVFDELARASSGGPADYAGLSHRRLDTAEALYWPCPDERHVGTPRLFADTFPTPDGRAKLVCVDHQSLTDALRPDAPIYLLTGRVLEHYQSGAQTRRVSDLMASSAEGFIEIHPHLADRLEVQDGDLIVVTSQRGAITAPARFSAGIRPDCVFAPFHFPGDALANAATDDHTDPLSGMPAFKACAVSVTPYQPDPEPSNAAATTGGS
ncbi:MAG: molybdopterin oxidoreductase family protein [Actinomycetota bacterium]